MAPNIVIQYGAGFKTTGEKLMGANAAAEGFLRAYLRYSGQSVFHATVPAQRAADDFREDVRRFAPNPDAAVNVYHRAMASAFAAVGCVYQEDPLLASLAWQRRWQSETAYSLCGVTHTTCSDKVLDSFGQLAIAPLYPWDAVICTSESVRITVERLHSGWSDYLTDRLGAASFPRIELPVIPLGVDCDSFDRTAADASLRSKWRTELRIADDEVVFLFFGRLSYHAKANPFPMYMALQAAAEKTGRPVHLILAGWFANDQLECNFRQAAGLYCPSIRMSVVDGRKLDVRSEIWAAADVFTSLSDNIQETFGLTPVEAMAAGLPCVISDWDGYQDTVRHEIEGLRIPTLMAPPGTGDLLMRRYFDALEDYDMYVGHTSHFTAVDIHQTTAAYASLIENPDLRRSLGQAGRRRAREVFDWRVIIGRYQELWTELASRRTAATAQPRPRSKTPHPLRPDPFALFSHYATSTLTPETQLGIVDGVTDKSLEERFNLPLLKYVNGPQLMGSLDELRLVLQMIQEKPQTVGDILERCAASKKDAICRSLVWMIKSGLVRHNGER